MNRFSVGKADIFKKIIPTIALFKSIVDTDNIDIICPHYISSLELYISLYS